MQTLQSGITHGVQQGAEVREPTNDSDRPAYFDQLCMTVEEIGRLRWVLRHIATLADDASGYPLNNYANA